MAHLPSPCHGSARAYRRSVQPLPSPQGKRRKKDICGGPCFRYLLHFERARANLGRAGNYRQATWRVVVICLDACGCHRLFDTACGVEEAFGAMITIYRYLVIQVLTGLAIATAILLPLFAFLDL